MIPIRTGEILTAYCNRKRINKSALSQKIGIGYQSLLKQLQSNRLPINVLLKISEGLEHNFLMDIAMHLPKNYATDVPIDQAAVNEIATLKEKIKLLEAEKQVLLQAIGMKG